MNYPHSEKYNTPELMAKIMAPTRSSWPKNCCRTAASRRAPLSAIWAAARA